MSDPYKDIGFDSNRIGFGSKAGIVVVDFQKGFTESRFPLGGRPMVDRAVNNTVDAACRGAQGGSAGRVLLHRLYQRARRAAMEDPGGGQRISIMAIRPPSSTSASTTTATT